MASRRTTTFKVPPPTNHPGSVAENLKKILIGQDGAIENIAPYVDLFSAGLNPVSRPAGVFILAGPTGTGKTHTVEALASTLHGDSRKYLRVNCGEFQMEHEVAKLVGAPPGYLGHRETTPLLGQATLSAMRTDKSGLALVLFDEIEKAAPSFQRILLGILDKGNLRTGDNVSVDFEKTLIFMTSNLGSKAVTETAAGGFGLPGPERSSGLNKGAISAIRKHFSPEFMNRVDEVLVYTPLGKAELSLIFDRQLEEIREHLKNRLYHRGNVWVHVTAAAKNEILSRSESILYGARELKRLLQAHIVRPIGREVLTWSGTHVSASFEVGYSKGEFTLSQESALTGAL